MLDVTIARAESPDFSNTCVVWDESANVSVISVDEPMACSEEEFSVLTELLKTGAGAGPDTAPTSSHRTSGLDGTSAGSVEVKNGSSLDACMVLEGSVNVCVIVVDELMACSENVSINIGPPETETGAGEAGLCAESSGSLNVCAAREGSANVCIAVVDEPMTCFEDDASIFIGLSETKTGTGEAGPDIPPTSFCGVSGIGCSTSVEIDNGCRDWLEGDGICDCN